MKLTTAITTLLFFAPTQARMLARKRGSKDAVSTLDSDEEAEVLFLREEEKVARDVYITLGGIWNEQVFANIAQSEQRHMDSMLEMINLYGLEDPASPVVGEFKNVDLQDMYDGLVARGQQSLLEALHVGAFIEEVDIKDLEDAVDETDEAMLDVVYENLMEGSYNHLRAFVSRITSLGITYDAQSLTQEEVDAILN